MAIAQLLDESLKGGLPVRLRAYDGSEAGPPDASATVILRSPDALARILTRPGELGLGRAYVAGDLDLEGDIYSLFALNVDANKLRIAPTGPSRSSGPSDAPPSASSLHRPKRLVCGAPSTRAGATTTPCRTTTTWAMPSTSSSSGRP